MGAYAEIAKVNAIIERTRSKSLGTRKTPKELMIARELEMREQRILKRRAAEEAEMTPNRPPRPLMFNPAFSSDSAQSA